MKRIFVLVSTLMLSLTAVGCTSEEVKVIDTIEVTHKDLVEEFMNDSKEIILNEYHELSDGTWKCDQYVYKYKITVEGAVPNSSTDTRFTVLSNLEEITFEQVWKASGLSSNLEDYFDEEEARIVAIISQ